MSRPRGFQLLLFGAALLALRASPAPAQLVSHYHAGDAVEIFSGTGKWYPATITRDFGKGSYLIRYEDGTEMVENESANMRLVRAASPPTQPRAAAPAPAPAPAAGPAPAAPVPDEPRAPASRLAGMSLTDLGILATDRFTEHPESSCPAAREYARRGEKNSKAAAVEVVLHYCDENGYGVSGKSARARPAGPPPLGRYACLSMGGVAESDGSVRDPVFGKTPTKTVRNRVAPDIRLTAPGRYSTLDASGTYTYDAATRTLTWTAGPLSTARTQRVGIYVPAGHGAKDPTIVIRDRRDVAAGNKRDLQWCNLAGR
jgi:hypothetical protein